MFGASKLCGICEGEALKKEGMERVSNNAGEDWRTAALRGIKLLASVEDDFTSDEARDAASEVAGEPHHYNAWGSICKAGVAAGYMSDTGKRVKSSRASRHRGLVTLYKSELR